MVTKFNSIQDALIAHLDDIDEAILTQVSSANPTQESGFMPASSMIIPCSAPKASQESTQVIRRRSQRNMNK